MERSKMNNSEYNNYIFCSDRQPYRTEYFDETSNSMNRMLVIAKDEENEQIAYYNGTVWRDKCGNVDAIAWKTMTDRETINRIREAAGKDNNDK